MKEHLELGWLINAVDKLPLAPEMRQQMTNTVRQNVFQSGNTLQIFKGYLNALLSCRQISGDDKIAFHLATLITKEEIGPIHYFLANACTVKEALDLLSEFYSKFFMFASLDLSQHNDLSRLTYKLNLPEHSAQNLDIALTLIFIYSSLKSKFNEQWKAKRIGFEFKKPDNFEACKNIHPLFADDFYWEQSSNYIELTEADLKTPVTTSNPNLIDFIKQFASKMESYTEKTSFYNAVKNELLSVIGDPGVDIVFIAKKLNISRATLQRKLTQENTCFRKIKEEVVFALAKQSLIETNEPISEIALMLGYSEISPFVRAFSRYSDGVSPLQFRKANT